MKTFAFLCSGLLLLGGCSKATKEAVTAESAQSLFEMRLKEEKRVTFSAWNGEGTDGGHTCDVTFQPEAKILVNAMGYGGEMYIGSFSLPGQGLVEAKIKEYPGGADAYWPRMLLRRDGEELLLYREDGTTAWHDRDWPYAAKSLEGFWPMRAVKKTEGRRELSP